MDERSTIKHFDVIIIGAGLAGLYATHKFANEQGLNVLGLEKGEGVGGTWYWNRYPGIHADTDSFVYRYSFDQEVSPLWDMHARYQTGAQMRDYLETIADRNNITPLYRFRTTVKEVLYDEQANLWRVLTDNDDLFFARYIVSGAGVLSKPALPDIDGLASFGGVIAHAARWPDNVNLDGKRVGLLGTGSTGTQVVVTACELASHLTVFQRSAQYIVPAGQRRLSEEEVQNYHSNFEEKWAQWRKTRLACGFDDPQVGATEVSLDEQTATFEKAWNEGGGFGFMFGTFSDLAFNPVSNRAACDFIKNKIREIVQDPETARKLIPDQPYAKRPASTDGYYEAFNRANVELISLKDTPILRATEKGIITSDGVEHELDILILATGFEAVEGAYRELSVVGQNGHSLLDTWNDHPSAYVGVSTPGFPNFFTLLGPQGIFSNLAAGIETQVNFIGEAIQTAGCEANAVIEATPNAVKKWSDQCSSMANDSIFAQVKSWIFGSNIHTDAPRALFYFGGLKEYTNILEQEKQNNFPSFNHLVPLKKNVMTSNDALIGERDLSQNSDNSRKHNFRSVHRYMHTRGQDRLTRHYLFVADGISGLWTTDTGKPIEIHGHESMASHAVWSLKCFPDWQWYNIRIHPCFDPNKFWVECEGRGAIHFPGYPDGLYHNHFLFSFEMKDGLILRAREFMNPTAQFRALGIDVPVIRREGIPQKHNTEQAADG
jgi:cyclohexanone monooxygenase